jgi:hypothetical protein
MGFYIRKSINLGAGVRLNLSNSGLGVSAGMKGLRVGMNGRGTYVHMGRGGIYYRQQFSYAPRRGRPSCPYVPPASHVPAGPASTTETTGLTRDLVPPIDVASTAANKEHILRHFERRTHPAQVIAILVGLVGLVAFTQSVPLGAFLLVCAVGAFAFAAIARSRQVLVYNLEDAALERFEAFVTAFDAYFQADRTWLYETSTPNFDWKRNAGASSFIKRSRAAATSSEDTRLHTNISVPRLTSGRVKLYFLPDVVVADSGGTLAAIDYVNLDMDFGNSTFIEEEGVASDARVIRHTWRFVRKDGGPDRRFNNNRQIPVCQYQQTVFLTAGGASRTFVQSRLASGSAFQMQLRRMREQIVTVTSVSSVHEQLAITYQPA